MDRHIKKYGLIVFLTFVFCMFYKPVICFLILGTFVFYYGFHYLFFLNSIDKKGVEVVGKILSYQSDGEGYKTPIIEFESKGLLIKEKPYYYASTDLSKFRTYDSNIEKLVPILYCPNNPERFILKSEKGFNYFSLFFALIVGLIFMIVGLSHVFGFIKIDGMN